MIAAVSASERDEEDEIVVDPSAVNIVFGLDPGSGNYDGVIGDSFDSWNLIDVGQTSIDELRCHSGEKTPIRFSVSENDGEWGIPGHDGIYHAYIYDINQSVDLQAKFEGLGRGLYQIYVYAHGDAPDQNAEIVLMVGDETLESKSTLNDGTDAHLSTTMMEGVQYVRFEFGIDDSQPVTITSKRAGSGYSMLNAIQIVRIMR